MLLRRVSCVVSTHLKSRPLTKQLGACQNELRKLDPQEGKDRNTD